ncbi:MAG: RNA 2',3'-cyclic phosphodiesterase [Thermodesulfovibrionia bacterium]
MRSFIAIELSETVRSALAELQKELKESRADIRWIKPENIHLTLKFLGNVDERITVETERIIKEICKKYSMFTLEVKGISAFPGMKSPRVLWVGINSKDVLIKIQKDIDGGTASLGVERENRRFTPHLTLGRFRSAMGKENLIDKIELHKNESFGLIEAKSISLIRSDLKPAGAQYTKIAEVSLGR